MAGQESIPANLHGVFVVDKPSGMTSHDVVSFARRATGERRIGHTGTLDPLATGVLPLACGRATRLVRFLTASDKDYDATIHFGRTTDTYDTAGRETSHSGAQPQREEVLQAIASLQGEYLQTPPAYSAKKVAGRRAYESARRGEAPELRPVPVRVARAELLDYSVGVAVIRLSCSAGFYVRTFAHSLGVSVGTGACLAALRRTRSGEFHLGQAVTLAELEGDRAVLSLVAMEGLLSHFPSVTVTEEGRVRISHGQGLDSSHIEGPVSSGEWVRLIDAGGALLAVATPSRIQGSLHPAIVLT